jgi:YbgC/YbaW family acyl-CoA thioester hydrolase
MHLLLRFLYIRLLKSKLTPAHFGEVTEHTMRVLPVDLDVLMHVNNGMYFSYMDFGRWDMIFRNGVYDMSRSQGWYSVVAGETIKFKRSLKLWDKFTIKTQVIGHDDKYFFIRQTFVKDNQVCAIGLVKVRFLRVSGGTVSTQEVLDLFKEDAKIPQTVPELSHEWYNLESKYLVEAT